MSRGFVESTTVGFARALTRTMLSEQTARQRGLLQSLDPRVRVVGLFALVLAVTLSRRIAVVAALFAVAIAIALFSRVSLLTLAKRVWLIVLGFTGVIALPALFTTPGRTVATVAGVRRERAGYAHCVAADPACGNRRNIHHAADPVHALGPGAEGAARSAPAEGSGDRMLAMTYRYVFLLVETAAQMLESRQSRTVGVLSPSEQRHLAATHRGRAAEQERRVE